MSPDVKSQIQQLVDDHPVLLFMKGNRRQPQCGFSAAVVEALDALNTPFKDVDVLADANLRQGVKEFSDWPTVPQLYVRGEFIGGCDIVRQMYATGELATKLGQTSGQ